MDIDTQSFQAEVVDASTALPVIVDFWAPWCAPCRTLGPLLEKLEGEYAGRFKLAKVNADENQALGSAFNVRSIPFVLAFRDGKPASQFVGALPESQVRGFIDLELASFLVEHDRVDEAEPVLERIRPNIDWDARVEALRAAIGFARGAGDEAPLKKKVARDPGDHEARLSLASLYAAKRDYARAMEELLEIVRRDKDWREGEARRQLLHLFTLAGSDADLVSTYRRKLATALY